MPTKNALTSLRFLAAFLVVGYHFFSFDGALTFLNGPFKHGHLGVEFFFILSGFVLGLRYEKEILQFRFNSKEFILLRLARIAPAYYLSLFIALPLLYKGFLNAPFLQENLNRSIFVFSNLSFTQSFFPAFTLIENWNVPSWSLSVEFFFYLCFPLLSLPLLKTKHTNIMLGGCWTLCFLAFYLSYQLPEEMMVLGEKTKVIWMNSFLLRFPEFLLGNILAKKYFEGWAKNSIRPLIMISLLLVALIFFAPLPEFLIAGGSPFVLLAFSLLIYAVAMNDNGTGWLNHRYLILLGEASYVLYICQAPLKVVFQQIYSKILSGSQTSGLLYSLYLGLALVLTSVIIYKLFEAPLSRYLRGKIKHV